MPNGIVRPAREEDSAGLLAIYAHYVKNTAATFETEVPSLSAFCARIHAIQQDYPFLVFEENDALYGYAYAAKSRERAAYRYNVDVSVYTRVDKQRVGVGTKLYEALFIQLAGMELYTAYAAITLPNAASVRLHERFGFTPVGVFQRTGYKLGAWRDVLWMEKALRDYNVLPE